jgi:hypothetical protein
MVEEVNTTLRVQGLLGTEESLLRNCAVCRCSQGLDDELEHQGTFSMECRPSDAALRDSGKRRALDDDHLPDPLDSHPC